MLGSFAESSGSKKLFKPRSERDVPEGNRNRHNASGNLRRRSGGEQHGFDPDPVALITLILSAVATVYQALSYHLPPQRQAVVSPRRAARRARVVRQLAAEVLGLTADFEGIQEFLRGSGNTIRRELEFRYGASSLVFRDAPQLSEGTKLFDRLLRRYSNVLKRANAVMIEIEAGPTALPRDLAQRVAEARRALNDAQFDSRDVQAAMVKTQKCLALVHDVLAPLSEGYERGV